ncbi:hypothetical protein [Arthrobacter sp. Leaf69]|uniref:hypothetical protein n=1 Tax=Arthrobacter sp. Leaf69 TaxID=1736232 RepID=UPI0012E291F5|nr:hypothetical protein [Arthrobacter sp. Leaf69]
MTVLAPVFCVALIAWIWLGSLEVRLALSFIVVLALAIILGVIGLCLLVAQRSTKAMVRSDTNTHKVNTSNLELLESIKGLGTALREHIDAAEQASLVRFERVEKRLGRQGRRIERTYQCIERHLGPSESTSNVTPLPTRLAETNDILDRNNAKLDRLRTEIDQSSKRLRDQSAQLRLIVKEQSKLSSNEVLVAKAAVIEELLEGMDSLVSHGPGREAL